MTCQATTHDGEPCSRDTAGRAAYCWQHAPDDESDTPTHAGDVRRERIIASLSDGCTYKEAAEAAGIARQTLWEWRQEDGGFARRCRRARAEAAEEMLSMLMKRAREGDTSAAQWWLSRVAGIDRVEPDHADLEPYVEAVRSGLHAELTDERAHEVMQTIYDNLADVGH